MAPKKQIARALKKRSGKNKITIFYIVFLVITILALILFVNEHWIKSPYLPSISDVYQTFGITKRPHITVDQDEIAVHFIDVGQGDCALVITPEKTMLIDCGEQTSSYSVIRYLRDFGVSRLDYVIASHPHSDHMGGMADIISAFDVGEFIMPEVPADLVPITSYYTDTLNIIQHRSITASYAEVGRRIDLCKGTYLDIIGPVGEEYEELNNYSVVAKLTSGNYSFLFTGDMEHLPEQQMVYAWVDLHADVIKVAHHGSSSSSSEDFIARVAPQYAVISVGKDNSYGHPSDMVVKRYSSHGCKILPTAVYGDVVFVTDGNELNFSTTYHMKQAA